MSTSSPPPPPQATKPADNILSYDSNVMLAAIISLLVVILFVLLLHIYAKWFLFRAQRRSRSVLATHHHHHHFHSFAIDAAHAASPTKGLESSAISSIPVFVFSSNNDEVIDECAICLSVFEAGELCRRLPGCSHAFHVECIDMWFQSHSTCPICRSCPVSTENGKDTDTTLLPEVQMEILVDDDRVRNAEIELCGAPPSSSSSSAAAAVGESVKRMMSRNRSERKIHPSEALVDSQV